jgi:LytS/YehU family sensor histidine kinase
MLGDSIHLELAIPRTAVESAASARLAWAHVVTIVLALGACVIALLLGRARHNEHLAAAERSLAATKLRAAQAEAAATRASLAEISARMNPHFLANAMHSVSALIAADPVAAEEAIDRLGDLFRASVDRSEQQVVRLEDEWQFVQDYLAIEQLRLGSRLRVALDLDPDARDCLVPTFILQPLVENAVRHGVAPMPHGGLVTVRARRVTGEIILDVSDDGAGADVAFVESARGTGLRTLRQRLALDPNARGRMELEASPGRGFRVRVVVADARDSDGPPWASPAASQVGATRSKA